MGFMDHCTGWWTKSFPKLCKLQLRLESYWKRINTLWTASWCQSHYSIFLKNCSIQLSIHMHKILAKLCSTIFWYFFNINTFNVFLGHQVICNHNEDAYLSTLTLQMPQDHYNDVIMRMMASQITGFSIVCSTIYSGTDQRKHQSSALLAFVTQRASNVENISIWWCHHDFMISPQPFWTMLSEHWKHLRNL